MKYSDLECNVHYRVTKGTAVNEYQTNRLEIELKEDWAKWAKKIPYIKIPNGCSVQPLPPFGGAMARFKVIAPSGEEVSIYLDVNNSLGYEEHPYWELYPYYDDVSRCGIHETDELYNAMLVSLGY